jgi:hypothetical protein
MTATYNQAPNNPVNSRLGQRVDRRRRALMTLLAVATALPLTVIGQASSQDISPRVIQVKIEKRKVIVPKRAIRITEDEKVELRWSSDEVVKLHLHGYDKELKVRPGKPTSMSITGRATGRFPITSHGWGHGGHGHHALTYLEVHPR